MSDTITTPAQQQAAKYLAEANAFIANLADLTQDADKIFFSPDGEDALAEFMTGLEKVARAELAIKTVLEQRALEMNPNFSTIVGNKVAVSYRQYGARYTFEPGLEQEVPEQLVKVEIKRSLDPKAVENYINETGGMPYGVQEKDREKKISITLKKGGSGE